MKIKKSLMLNVVDPLNYAGWDELLLAGGKSSFFHSSFWARVLHNTYGYKPLYFSAFDRGKVSVLIPLMEVQSIITGKRGVSLPFSDYCEMIISEQVDFVDVMNALVEYGKRERWKSIELMDGRYLPENTLSSSSYYGHILDLENKDASSLLCTFSNNTKRNIRKALQQGVIVTRDDSIDSVKEFYHLHCMTRKRHGIPPQPYIFFENIHKHVFMSGHGFVAMASHQGKNIACSIYFHFGDQAIFKFGASDISYKHLRANSLVMWKAIEWCNENGIKRLSFGRTAASDEGLRRFKKGWGTVERMIKYFKYDLHADEFISKSPYLSDLQISINRKLPLFVLKTAGDLLYKHIG